MRYTKFQGQEPLGSEEGDFECFYHIWTWSCDPEDLNKFSSQHPMEAVYKIWLQTALCVLKKRSLKMLNLSDLDLWLS